MRIAAKLPQFLTFQASVRGPRRGDRARQEPQRHCARRRAHQSKHSPCRRTRHCRRSTTRNRRSCCCPTPIMWRRSCGCLNPTTHFLYVTRLLDPRVAPQVAGDARARAGICRDRAAARRRSGRLRADVHGDRADRPVVGGLDRAQFRQPTGGADPPAHRRRQFGVHRQLVRARAGARSRRATSPSSARPSTA